MGSTIVCEVAGEQVAAVVVDYDVQGPEVVLTLTRPSDVDTGGPVWFAKVVDNYP